MSKTLTGCNPFPLCSDATLAQSLIDPQRLISDKLSFRRVIHLFLTDDADIPATCLPLEGRSFDGPFDLSACVEAHPANLGEIHAISSDLKALRIGA